MQKHKHAIIFKLQNVSHSCITLVKSFIKIYLLREEGNRTSVGYLPLLSEERKKKVNVLIVADPADVFPLLASLLVRGFSCFCLALIT